MASAFNKEVRRSITHSLGRFLAIAVIAALGCGFYAGLRMTPLDMNLSADAFYDRTDFSDIYVTGTLGLEDEDIQNVRALQDVESVCPEQAADAYALIDEIKYVVRLNSIGSGGMSVDDADYVNKPELVQGRWPENKSECVLAADPVLDEPARIGQVVRIVDMNGKISDTFSCEEYSVVGLVRSPYYVCTSQLATTELGSGGIDTYAYIPDESFASDIPYTGAYITVAGARDVQYPSDSYDALVDPVKVRLENAGYEFSNSRLAAVKSDAQAKLDEARADYQSGRDDALAQLDEAYQQLTSAKDSLDDARAQLEANEAKLDASAIDLANAAKQLANTPAELDAKQAELDEAQRQYESGIAQLQLAREQAEERFAEAEAKIAGLPPEQQEYARAQLERERLAAYEQFESQQAALDATQAKIEEGESQIALGRERYAAALVETQQGRSAYESGREQLAQGWAEYEDGLAQYESGLADYESKKDDALRELDKAKADIDDAQAKIDSIEAPDWYVLDRSKNLGAASRRADAERIDQIAQVFPFIFFLVAALVSLTTMTRMVDEERMLIGTHKALGYTSVRIASKYLIYAFVASGAGCIIGVLALTQFLPQFIISAYSTIYAIPIALSPIDPPLAFLAIGLAVGITVGATLFAVLSTLRERPALLMLPRVPKPGKRILLERVGPLWRRLTFTSKVTARNIFRYKRRFLMAIIGIAGCTALLLTGLGLHDGINDIISKQFGEILHYNLEIQVSDEQSADDAARVERILSETPLVTEQTRCATQSVITCSIGGDEDQRTTLCVPDDITTFGQFTSLRTRNGHDNLDIANGAVISEKLSTQLGIGAGDSIEVYEVNVVGDQTGAAYNIVVSGICEYYTGQRVFVSPECYEEAFGRTAQSNNIICMAEGPLEERTALSDKLLEVGGVEVVSYYDEVIETYQKMLETVNAVVIVLVVAAALLAFVVLYNLTNINISERTREIATLKVLGFTPHEVNAYIYRETILLTLIGALVGCALGVVMESFVVVTAEVNQIMFGREIHIASFVIALALTVSFSLIVTFAMKMKLNAINMVESLKSVD
jgi:putative ABC transport system permease protein